MAQLIERGILEGVHTIVEAGTGVGKCLAYLSRRFAAEEDRALDRHDRASGAARAERHPAAPAGARRRAARDAGQRPQSLPVQAEVRAHARRSPHSASRSMQAIWAWAAATQTGDRGELPFVAAGRRVGVARRGRRRLRRRVLRAFRDCWFFKKARRGQVRPTSSSSSRAVLSRLSDRGGCCPHTTSPCWTKRINASAGPDALTRPSRARPSTGCCENCTQLHVPAHFDVEFDGGLRGLESALARVEGERYRCPPTRTPCPRWMRCATRSNPARNWIDANWHKASKATGERSRGRRGAIWRRARSSPTPSRSIARKRRRGVHCVGRARRGRRRYAVRCAPFDVAHFCKPRSSTARRASC